MGGWSWILAFAFLALGEQAGAADEARAGFMVAPVQASADKASMGAARVLPPCPPDAPRLDHPMRITVSTALDRATGLYTYSYSAFNPPSNPAALDTIVVRLAAGVELADVKAPTGWHAFYFDERGQVLWGATGHLNPDEEGDPSGQVAQSDYAVKPGESLGGFSFKSSSPPGPGLAITQTYAPLPSGATKEEVEALVSDPCMSQLPDDNGYRIQTTAPIAVRDSAGRTPPTVEGFLVVDEPTDGTAVRGPVRIAFRFAVGGEAVDTGTLLVELNGTDITGRFAYDEARKAFVATLPARTEPLVVGRNVLSTSVRGRIPGKVEAPTLDIDRVTFTVLP